MNATPFLQNIVLKDTSAKCLLFTKSSLTAVLEQGGTKSLLEYLVASDSAPVSAQLNAVDTAGNVPSWLRINNKLLKGVAFTTGSEISFDVNAINLTVGKYMATVRASGPGYEPAVLKVSLMVK